MASIVQVTSDKLTPLPGPRNCKKTGDDFRARVRVTLMGGAGGWVTESPGLSPDWVMTFLLNLMQQECC